MREDGFFVVVTPRELAEHLDARADYHRSRAAELTTRIKTVKKSAEKGFEQFAGLGEGWARMRMGEALRQP